VLFIFGALLVLESLVELEVQVQVVVEPFAVPVV
jgi:hypothetical protein